MDRRDFLRSALAATGALAIPSLLAACTKEEAPVPARSLKELIDARRKAGSRQGVSVFSGGADYVSGISNYLSVGLVTPPPNEGRLEGRTASLWLAQGAAGEGQPLGPYTAGWQPYATPDEGGPSGINAGFFAFPQPGIWQMLAEVDAPGGPVYGTQALEVRAKGSPGVPVVGDRAIATKTPTVSSARGVDPICTREPRCPFHELSLHEALEEGRPVAFQVGTPRFCTSRTCGPNIEELILIAREVGDRARFVHSEVYANDDPDTIARQQPVAAAFREWKLPSEPWLFLMGRDGRIAERFEGPLVAGTIRQRLTPLLS